MNRTAIETFDYVFNPITGCYGPGGSPEHPARCSYCYAQRMAHRFGKSEAERAFIPVFHPERLGQPGKVKKPSTVFVCSVADLFGEYVPDEWIAAALEVTGQTPRHQFFFLTKNPQNMAERDFSANSWLGVSVTSQEDMWRALQLARLSPLRVKGKRFLSIEPLLEPIIMPSVLWHCFHWVIIGAWTGAGATQHVPKREWVESLTAQCVEAGIPVWHKSSLGELATRKEKA